MTATKGYCDGPFGQIHYRTAGDGIPLILCHQSLTSSIQFDEAFRHLAAAGIQAIAFDIPGYGMSDRPASPPDIAGYASLLPSLMEHFHLNTTHLLGHHTGAVIVTEMALTWPDKIEKVIQNGPVPVTPEERQFFIDNAVANEKAWALKEDGSHFMDSWTTRTAVTPGWSNLESMSRQVNESVRAGVHGWYAHNAVFSYDHGEAMKKLTQPNLILINSGDGIAHLAQRAHEMCPHFTYVEMEGGTHDIVDEQPDAWAKEVATYIKA